MEGDRKRPSDGPVSDAKRVSTDNDGPVTSEDIEEFQKDALFRELTSCKRQRDELQAQLDASKVGDDKLKEELKALTEKYLDASKRVERLSSPIVARVMHIKNGESTSSADSPSAETSSKPESTSEGQQIPEGNESAQILELKSKLAAAQGEVEKTKEFISVEDKKRQELESRVRALDEKLASAPKTAEVTESRLKEAYAETQRLAEEARDLQKEISELKAGQNDFENKVRQKNEANVAALESRLAAAEGDVGRIRSARDELLSEVNILKAESAEHRNEAVRYKELAELSSVNGDTSGATNGTSGDSTAKDAEFETLPSDADGLKERCWSLIRQNKALSEEITGLEQGFSRASAKAKQAVKATASAEQKLGVLNTAKVRSDEKYINAMRARDSMSQELQRTKAVLARSAEVVSDLKAQEQRVGGQVSKLQRQVAQTEVLLQQRKHENDLIRRSKAEADGLVATLRLGSEKLREQLAQRDVEKAAADMARRNAETDVEKLKRELDTQRAINGLGSATDVQEQLESLRSIAMCPVCQKNWKNRAISTCGHTLCNECVQNRLNARMRSCPMCNGHFASNDVLPIHL